MKVYEDELNDFDPPGKVTAYTGENIIGVKGSTKWVVKSGVTNATDAGTYSAVVSVKDCGNLWDDETDEDRTYTWSITQVVNYVTTPLSMGSYRCTSTPAVPVFAAKYGTPVITYYRNDVAVGNSAPTEAGEYTVGVQVPGTVNWTEIPDLPENRIAFTVYGTPHITYKNWVDIRVEPIGAKLTKVKFRIDLSESLIPGFLYSQMPKHSVGDHIAVTDGAGVDGGEEYLPTRVISWNPGGTSVIDVRIAYLPAEGMTIRMYWGNRMAIEDLPVWDDSFNWNYSVGYETTSNEFCVGLVSLGTDSTGGTRENRWQVEPSLSKTSWTYGEEPAVADKGAAYEVASSDIGLVYSNIVTGATSSDMPEKPGSYRATFSVAELTTAYLTDSFADYRSALTKAIAFSIAKATNAVTSFTMEGWIAGQGGNEPSATVLHGTPTFAYYDANGTLLGEKPNMHGKYYVGLSVAETEMYDGITDDPERRIAFNVGQSPHDAFADWMEVYVPGSGSAVADAEIAILLPDYVGSDVRATRNELYLPQVSAASPRKLTVKLDSLPADGATIRLYWAETGTPADLETFTPGAPTATVSEAAHFGLVSIEGVRTNRWVTLPTITPASWGFGSTPGTMDVGAAVEGNPESYVVVYSNKTTHAGGYAMPSAKGEYAAIVTVPGETDSFGDVRRPMSATVDFAITKSVNEITTPLAMTSWRYGNTPSTPSCTVKFGTPVYVYFDSGMHQLSAKPETAGDYYVAVTVPETDDYTGIAATDPGARIAFSIFDSAINLFDCWVDLFVPGALTDQNNAKVKVTISPELCIGFAYDQFNVSASKTESAEPDFRVTDSAGEYLPMRFESWPGSGESTVWVNVPTLPTSGTTIRLYWGTRGTMEAYVEIAPAPGASAVRATTAEDYGLVSVNGVRVNRWKVTPELTPVMWAYGENACVTIVNGVAYEINTLIMPYYVDRTKPASKLTELPQDYGNYVAHFVAGKCEDARGLRQELELKIPFSITTAVNEVIVPLSMTGWRTGEAPTRPVFQTKYGTPVYYWSSNGTDWVAWTPSRWDALAPTQYGAYKLKAVVPASAGNNYTGVEATCDFGIYRGANEMFRDYVDIRLIDYVGDPLTNVPVRIAIWKDSEPRFELMTDGAWGTTYPVAFDYTRLREPQEKELADIRFVVKDSADYLPQEIEKWRETINGVKDVSYVWVRVPELTSAGVTLRMYCSAIDSNLEPAPAGIWANYTRDEAAAITADVDFPFGLYVRDGVCDNLWVGKILHHESEGYHYPSLSKTMWDVGEEPAEVSLGDAMEDGDLISVVYCEYPDRNPSATMPTEAGSYVARFTVPAATNVTHGITRVRNELVYEIEFYILTHAPYDAMSGDGRVLLFNADFPDGADGEHAVRHQGYCVTTTNTPYHWERLNSYDYTAGDNNLQPGTEFIYRRSSDNAKIWHLVNCRMGNTFPTGNDEDLALHTTSCYLPWSATSKSILNAEIPDAKRATVGWCVMLNYGTEHDSSDTKCAAIYSPCYEEGVGTIYFDVVNCATNQFMMMNEFYVEYATNTAAYSNWPPDDRHSITVDSDTHRTNWYGNIKSWIRARPHVLRRDWSPADYALGPRGFVDEGVPPSYSVTPMIRNTGSTNNFYRVYVPIDTTCPTRFRIRRVSENPQHVHDFDDRNNPDALIAFDNIVVSYPAMRAELRPFGVMDPGRGGKQTLGQEGAFNEAFPGVTTEDLVARAEPVYVANGGVTNADVSDFIAVARLNYRWRYLSQLWWVNGQFKTDEKTAGWSAITLEPGAEFRTVRDLDLPRDNEGGYLQGDLEWWYSLILRAPFYRYYDYSGVGLGVPGCNEEHLMVTNRLSGTILDSQGTDWFTRLRDGRSDTEGMNLYVRHLVSEDNKTTNYAHEVTEMIEMELVFDNVWRGYLRTPLMIAENAHYRLERLNRQSGEVRSFAYNTNCFYTGEPGTFPVSATLEEGTTNDWSELRLDGKSGYALFQYDETTRALTVVHGDYQNFNRWDDANDDAFVGTSGNYDSTTMKGQSRKKRDFYSDYSRYRDMPPTNSFWRFSSLRDIGLHFYGHTDPYVDFALEMENGWEVGQAQWIAKHYADGRWDRDEAAHPWKEEWDDAGVAAQLRGCGEGYLEMNASPEQCPRGLDTVSFNARLAQSLEFDKFAYYSGEAIKRMTNYTFATRATFDTRGNTDFTGAATLSVAAYYRPSIGCYEARFEQAVGIPYPDDHSCVIGPNVTNQLFSIYRWNIERSGKVTQTLLTQVELSSTNGMPSPLSPYPILDTNEKFMPIAISVESTTNGTLVTAQLSYDGLDLTRGADEFNDLGWTSISVHDTSDRRMTSGTYGVLSVNCDGIFAKPQYFDEPIGEGGFATNVVRGCDVELNDDLWEIYPGRMKYENGWFDVTNGFHWVTNGYVYVTNYLGDVDNTYEVERVAVTNVVWELTPQYHPHVQYLCSDHRATPQKLYVYLGQAGTDDKWVLFQSLDITGFGHPGRQKDYVFPLYWRGNSRELELNSDRYYAIRFETGGTVEDVRVDVAVDSVELTQWLGDDYDNCGKAGYVNPYEKEYGGNALAHSNFVFTQCWITNHSLLMNAKRVSWEKPCSIRSPLMDNTYTRGSGFGMFSFEYREATENMNILFQINTTVTYTSVGQCDVLDDTQWHTITNFDFSRVSALQRRSGVMSVYLGYHGAKGVMRILVDPELVRASRYQTDPATFPQIRIVKAFCRDEPSLDEGSWWAWNLRTYGTTDGSDPEGKMYLPDATLTLGKQGNSLCLNNSTVLNIDVRDSESYKLNLPFLQTPNFTGASVGEITFKARKFGYSDSARDEQPALVTLYGKRSPYEDGVQSPGQWERVEDFVVSNYTFTTYTHQTEPGDDFAVFRLAVTGVPNASQSDYTPDGGLPRDGTYSGYATPVRVLVDEVLVTEAVRARMGLTDVGAFRHDLLTTVMIPNVPSEYEQPLCHEEWGVQGRIYAAQLADKIDMTLHVPRVRLWWYRGISPWGFDRWRDQPGCRSAWLGRATDTNFVYRSSYVSCEAAVMDAESKPGTVVQYMLEVVYYQNDSDHPMTNYMTSADWHRPDWYRGVDYNRTLGQNEHFAAYTILDEVAPHWAWINEVNCFGAVRPSTSAQVDKDAQYIEIAAPIEADITGWEVRLLQSTGNTPTIITNRLAKFGEQLPGRKTVNAGSNMVFHVLGSSASKNSGKFGPGGKYDDQRSTIDGVWRQLFYDERGNQITGGPVAPADGMINHLYPVGVQLVRSSGVIESEVTFLGYNMWRKNPSQSKIFDPASNAEHFNEIVSGAHFVSAGTDDCTDDDEFRGWGTSASLNVMVNYGSETNDWTNGVYCTPGTINWGQYINPDHPTPNGQTILIYFNLTGPHIVQTVGDLFLTNQTAMVALKKGSDLGTNVTYRVDPWYELAPVTTNGTVTTDGRLLERDEHGYRWYEYTVGVHCSNAVSVYASAELQHDIPIDDNVYRDAVEDWINEGTDVDGNPWENWEDGVIYLADFIPLSRAFTNKMTLTEMYWLDMDPTVSNQAFIAGVVKPAMPEEMRAVELPWGGEYRGDATVTNTTMTYYLMLTNQSENVEDVRHYGKAWTPYVLRGVEPGSNSLSFENDSTVNWTSETFKVEGILANGRTEESQIDYWVPLRYFVFHRDSFPQKGEPHEGETVVSVLDPFSTESPGFGAGWWEWARTHGAAPVFYRWNLDTRRQPYSVEVLQPTNSIVTRKEMKL